MLARFPDVLTVTKAEEDVETIAADICAVLDDALTAYNEMRAVEGAKLAEDIGSRADTIEADGGPGGAALPGDGGGVPASVWRPRCMEVLQSATIDESQRS